MTDKQPEALRLADELDCRGMNRPSCKDQFDAGYELRRLHKENEALRARLAQPEQRSEKWWRHEVSNAFAQGYEKGRASVKQPDLITPADVEQLARIEKLVDKIDPYGAQPEQEPVAWADKYDIERDGHDFWVSRQQPAKNGVPLYTAPPQRKWQGLTDEEKLTIVRETDNPVDALAATEAKLKENNCVVLSKECYERGCAAYDDRVDEGVMIPKEKNSD